MRIYTHLLPSSEDRARRAVDQAFADDPDSGDDHLESRDGLETA